MYWPEAVHHKVDFSQCTKHDELLKTVSHALSMLPEPACVIAWSLGAFLALEIAQSVSNRIQSLHLIGVGSQFTHTKEFPYGWKQRILQRMKVQLEVNPDEVIHYFDQKLFSPAIPDAHWKQLRKPIPPVSSLVCGLDYLQEFDINRISHINSPTFLLIGENDGIILSEGTNHLHQLLPNSTLTCWCNTGHIPFWGNAHRFYQWIKNSY